MRREMCLLVLIAVIAGGRVEAQIGAQRIETRATDSAIIAELERGVLAAPQSSFKTIREISDLPADVLHTLGGADNIAEWGDTYEASGQMMGGPRTRHVVSWVSPDFALVVYQGGRTFLHLTGRGNYICTYILGWEIPSFLTLALIHGELRPDRRNAANGLVKSECIYGVVPD